MSGLGDKIKAVFSSGEHSKEAEQGYADHRTPGAFPSDEPSVHGGVDHSHAGSNPVSSTHSALGGTSQDPSLTTGSTGSTAGHGLGHDRSAVGTGVGSAIGSGSGSGAGLSGALRDTTGRDAYSSSTDHPSSLTGSTSGTGLSSRPDPLHVSGTGATGAGAAGLAATQLGGDRSSQNQGSALPSSNTRTTGYGVPASTGYDTSNTGGRSNALGPTGSTATGAGALANQGSNNTVTNGREKSAVPHEEPYWGDLPQGAGVYNTVTGHGSGEDTSAQHRTVPRTGHEEQSPRSHISGAPIDQSTFGSGVYNTVTGHGSGQDPAHHISDSQRATTQGTASNLGQRDSSRKDHHLAEGAAVGAGAAAYGASERHHHSKDSERPLHESERLASGHATSSDTSPGQHGAGLIHRHKDQNDSIPVDKSRDTNSHSGGFLHRHKDETVSTTPATIGSQYPSHTTATGTGPDARQLNERDTHSGRNVAGLGAVGAAAGAGYGASRLGQHHEHNQSTDPYAQSQESVRRTGQTGQGAYNTLSDGTPSGVAQGTQHYTNSSFVGPSTGTSSSAQHASQDTSSGPYNVLSSGTPSGVHNTETPTQTSSNTHTSTNTGSSYEPKVSFLPSTTGSTGQDVADLARQGPTTGAYTQHSQSGSSGPIGGSSSHVVHKCDKCGEDNDISEYLHE